MTDHTSLSCESCNGSGSYHERSYCGTSDGPEHSCAACGGRGYRACAWCDGPATNIYNREPICIACLDFETREPERAPERELHGSRCTLACGFCGACS